MLPPQDVPQTLVELKDFHHSYQVRESVIKIQIRTNTKPVSLNTTIKKYYEECNFSLPMIYLRCILSCFDVNDSLRIDILQTAKAPSRQNMELAGFSNRLASSL